MLDSVTLEIVFSKYILNAQIYSYFIFRVNYNLKILSLTGLLLLVFIFKTLSLSFWAFLTYFCENKLSIIIKV